MFVNKQWILNCWHDKIYNKTSKINCVQWVDDEKKLFLCFNSAYSNDFKEFLQTMKPYMDNGDIDIEIIYNLFNIPKSRNTTLIISFLRDY